jgi:hypothetical protein
MTQERGICREIARVPHRAGLTHTTIAWRHSADSSINARWSVRRKPATAGSTTADPPQMDAYGTGGAAFIGFAVTFNRAVLEVFLNTEIGNFAWLQRIVSR